VTVRLKSVYTEALLPSVAVMRIDRLPTSALTGVPEKVPVAVLKAEDRRKKQALPTSSLSSQMLTFGS